MSETEKNFSKRTNVLVYIFLIFFGLIIYQLVNKQIIGFNYFSARASNQYTLEKEIPAQRGKIYSQNKDGSKSLLATNIRKYQVSVVPKNVKNKETVSEILAEKLNIPKEEIFNKINNDKTYIPPIAKKVERSVVNSIVAENLAGVIISPESDRYYPENGLASQLLGFVNADQEGQYGLEGYYNNELKGLGGVVEGEKDTRGQLISLDSQINPKNGTDLILTIDRNIQYYAEKTIAEAVENFKAEKGSVIIMDVKTGDILAMANAPTYNNNEYSTVKSEDSYLYKNAAIADIWEPGSIYKPIVMGMALQEGAVTPDTTNVFGSSVKVQNYTIETATKKAFGKENMTQVLENSDNVAMVWVAEQLGTEKMYSYMIDKMKTNKKIGIDLDTESQGNILALKNWRDVTRATSAFGQGFALTPLKIVQLYAAIANGGKMILPHVVGGMVNDKGAEQKVETKELDQIYSKEVADELTQMLIGVVEKGHGKRAGVAGYKVAGKTGTAQIPDPDNKGYLQEDHIGSFAGFFPADNPKYAMLVKLDKPKGVQFAESSAAPTFGTIAQWLLNYEGILPNQPK